MHYQNRFVAFIDILGFSNKVLNSINNNTQLKKLQQTIKSINEIENLEKKYPISHIDNKITTFSDSIILSCLSNSEDSLFYILLALIYIQIHLAMNDTIVRGGVTEGFLHHTRKEIYGPAFIEAYELEKQIAIYPRIILSRKLQEKVINSNAQEIMELIRQDSSDLNYYIIFIGQINEFNNDDGCFWEYQEFLRKIKGIINVGLANEDPHIRQKYLWLSSYYNEGKKLNISEL